jgi:hypothetical protein
MIDDPAEYFYRRTLWHTRSADQRYTFIEDIAIDPEAMAVWVAKPRKFRGDVFGEYDPLAEGDKTWQRLAKDNGWQSRKQSVEETFGVTLPEDWGKPFEWDSTEEQLTYTREEYLNLRIKLRPGTKGRMRAEKLA